MIQKVEGLMGRTDWDRSFSSLNKPDAFYAHVGELLRPIFYEKRWKLDQCDRYSIIYTNAGHPRRGTEDLLCAVAFLKKEFPSIRLRLAGTVSKQSGYGRYLRKQIFKLNLDDHVELLGYMNEEEMVSAMLSSHVFTITSYIENSPNSLAEAMLLGMPCVASYTGGIPSMVDHGNTGLLFPVGDVPLLSDKIKNFFKDSAAAKTMGENAHNIAKVRHSPSKVINQVMEAYKEIINND